MEPSHPFTSGSFLSSATEIPFFVLWLNLTVPCQSSSQHHTILPSLHGMQQHQSPHFLCLPTVATLMAFLYCSLLYLVSSGITASYTKCNNGEQSGLTLL